MAAQSFHLSLNYMIQHPECRISVIDDDENVRKGISLLLLSGGYIVESFESARDFLATDMRNQPGCILLDIFLDRESGLELQDAINDKFPNWPIIYVTGHGDIPMSVKALKNGAANFLLKPIDESQLFIAVDEAISNSQCLMADWCERNAIKTKIDSLTPRELEIFRNVIKGTLNKQIAAKLNIAEHTVKLHRGRITEKLRVKSVPEMIHMAEKLQII
jgi:FixJ family two-component response regulator